MEVLLGVESHVRSLAHEVRLLLLTWVHALIRLESTSVRHISWGHAGRSSHRRIISPVTLLRLHIHVVLHLTLSTLPLAILHLVLTTHIHLVTGHSRTHIAEMIILVESVHTATRITSSASQIAVSVAWSFIHAGTNTWLLLLGRPLILHVVLFHLGRTATHVVHWHHRGSLTSSSIRNSGARS